METPRLLSEYFAARAQSVDRISAKVVVASATRTTAADVEMPGSARVSRAGERVLAITNFSRGFASGIAKTTPKKSPFWRDAQTNTRDACATRKAVWPRFLVAFEQARSANSVSAVLQRLAIHRDCAAQNGRGKTVSFHKEAGGRGLRHVQRF